MNNNNKDAKSHQSINFVLFIPTHLYFI